MPRPFGLPLVLNFSLQIQAFVVGFGDPDIVCFSSFGEVCGVVRFNVLADHRQFRCLQHAIISGFVILLTSSFHRK